MLDKLGKEPTQYSVWVRQSNPLETNHSGSFALTEHEQSLKDIKKGEVDNTRMFHLRHELYLNFSDQKQIEKDLTGLVAQRKVHVKRLLDLDPSVSSLPAEDLALLLQPSSSQASSHEENSDSD